jgi:hypothetical protein
MQTHKTDAQTLNPMSFCFPMNANQEPSPSVTLSVEQIKALEHIAQKNHATPAILVLLAVDALIVEASRYEGWLPLPKIPDTHASHQRSI